MTVIASQAVPQERVALGWVMPDFGRARALIASEKEALSIFRDVDETHIHVFSGMRPGTMERKGFRQLCATAATIGIMAETGDWRGMRGAARLGMGILDRMRFHRHIAFVLAIGSVGVKWFRACGYPEERIFPYGYFVDRSVDVPRRERSGGPFRVAFVGSLVKGKGIDLLIEALAGIREEWHLSVIGSGPELRALEDLVASRGLTSCVKFSGVVPFDRVQPALAEYDLLALPSRWKDGWGVVVNEALLAGTPVVCTDACGASDLLREEWRGSVVPAGSIIELRAALQRQMGLGNGAVSRRRRISQWADRIQGPAAARYLLQVIEAAAGRAARPIPPWWPAEVSARSR